MPETHRRLAARLQEAFAAFLEHTDAQLGRLFAELERLDQLDNTMIVFLSDNGASQEGGPFGVMHEMKFFNFILESPEEAIERIDDIGGPHSHTNYPWGWAQAGNTPFKWYKQNTHEGGVHVPLIVNWPGRIPDPGGLRDQFCHVIDIVPTIYAALGVEPPAVYRGKEQLPITGAAFDDTFASAGAAAPRSVQYFEMMGHRAIYADGWKAVTRHQSGTSFEDDRWELYHLVEDRSECHNLAAELPDKVAELVALWWDEAAAHGVLPLDDRTIELFGTRFRDRSPHPSSRHYVYYPPMTPLPAQAGPPLGGRSWELRAAVNRPAGVDGVLYAQGTENSGLSLFVQDEHLVFDYNCFGEHHVVVSGRPVPEGESVIGVQFHRVGKGATATLVIDGAPAGSLELPFAMFIMSSIGASVGEDHGSAVSDRYVAPNRFEGDVRRVDITLTRPGDADATKAAETEERAAMARQ